MLSGDLFSFGPYRLDLRTRRLSRDAEVVRLADRHFDLLRLFVSRPHEVLSKDVLNAAAWPDVTVSEHSLDQAIFVLRRTLVMPSGEPCIDTLPRRGYRFVLDVAVVKRRASDADLDAVLDTHQAWLEGRAALESLDVDSINRARAVFADVVTRMPEEAWAHVGLANACAMQFEMNRTSPDRDTGALVLALDHAREAVHLDKEYGEAWATLGFVLERVGQRERSIAAARHAIVLEPDNWRHHLRLSAASWGEERLGAARRTLALVPGLAMAHWLAATVLVARQAIDQAEAELIKGLGAGDDGERPRRFGAVALHWLHGLILLSRGEVDAATKAFNAELDTADRGHLYAREVATNTWYALGGARFRRGDIGGAQAAFGEALQLLPSHPMATAGLGEPRCGENLGPIEKAVARIVARIARGNQADWAVEAASLAQAFTAAPAGNSGWLIPVEPMLHVSARRDTWALVAARLRDRAS